MCVSVLKRLAFWMGWLVYMWEKEPGRSVIRAIAIDIFIKRFKATNSITGYWQLVSHEKRLAT